MSRTDKDRAHSLQWADPENRRYAMIGNHRTRGGHDGEEHKWMKLSPACHRNCSCRGWGVRSEKRQRRSSWKRELKSEW